MNLAVIRRRSSAVRQTIGYLKIQIIFAENAVHLADPSNDLRAASANFKPSGERMFWLEFFWFVMPS